MTITPPELDTQRRVQHPYVFKRHDELLSVAALGGSADQFTVNEVLAQFPTLPNWPAGERYGSRGQRIEGANLILQWLRTFPGDGWQQRWVASGADRDLAWIDELVHTTGTASPAFRRDKLIRGLGSLLLCRIVMPSYEFLASYSACKLYLNTQQAFRPDLFAILEARGQQLGARRHRLNIAMASICKMVLHTGRDVDQLTAEDLFAFRAWSIQRGHGIAQGGLSLAWSLLSGVADLGEHTTLKDAVRYGQRPTRELIDNYQLQSNAVRELMIRYLDERRAGLDYSSFTGLVSMLAGTFWADIERFHPGLDTLHLPDEVAETWKQRLRTITLRDGRTRPRKQYLDIIIRIRGFYLDLQELALQDPSWAQWAVPCPIRKGESTGLVKVKQRRTAEMHQRVRDRLPHLPTLIDTAKRHKNEEAALLAAATAASVGGTFEHNGHEYRRVIPKTYTGTARRGEVAPVRVNELVTGDNINLVKTEHDAFWAWAVIETLRHTGVRIEELSEITHLSLISYKLPDTGEIVPMLQIVPSKANEERLLLVSPDLASVLAAIVSRLRRENAGAIPLTARYDPHERLTGPPLPHLFQHRRGWKWEVPSPNTIQSLLTQTLARAGLCDAAGQPLRYTAHDFRRMFATEAVTGGLPVHIVARLLGHANINTTQAYMAVVDEELVRVYRAFLDARRATRPEAEYRQPTDQEWQEFQQHFHARKLELGECGRPYGTPCKHEHACIRCPSLRLDPSARPRLISIIANLNDRIQEARLNGWLGEVQGLQSSTAAAAEKLVALDRMRDRRPDPIGLGMPIITTGLSRGSRAALTRRRGRPQALHCPRPRTPLGARRGRAVVQAESGQR